MFHSRGWNIHATGAGIETSQVKVWTPISTPSGKDSCLAQRRDPSCDGGVSKDGVGVGTSSLSRWVRLTHTNEGKCLPGGAGKEGQRREGGAASTTSRGCVEAGGPRHVQVDVWAPSAAALTWCSLVRGITVVRWQPQAAFLSLLFRHTIPNGRRGAEIDQLAQGESEAKLAPAEAQQVDWGGSCASALVS